MVDHPLVSTQLRQYIQKNKIEELMNEGLNIVMAQLPQDPYSTMATTLINVSQKTCTNQYNHLYNLLVESKQTTDD